MSRQTEDSHEDEIAEIKSPATGSPTVAFLLGAPEAEHAEQDLDREIPLAHHAHGGDGGAPTALGWAGRPDAPPGADDEVTAPPLPSLRLEDDAWWAPPAPPSASRARQAARRKRPTVPDRPLRAGPPTPQPRGRVAERDHLGAWARAAAAWLSTDPLGDVLHHLIHGGARAWDPRRPALSTVDRRAAREAAIATLGVLITPGSDLVATPGAGLRVALDALASLPDRAETTAAARGPAHPLTAVEAEESDPPVAATWWPSEAAPSAPVAADRWADLLATRDPRHLLTSPRAVTPPNDPSAVSWLRHHQRRLVSLQATVRRARARGGAAFGLLRHAALAVFDTAPATAEAASHLDAEIAPLQQAADALVAATAGPAITTQSAEALARLFGHADDQVHALAGLDQVVHEQLVALTVGLIDGDLPTPPARPTSPLLRHLRAGRPDRALHGLGPNTNPLAAWLLSPLSAAPPEGLDAAGTLLVDLALAVARLDDAHAHPLPPEELDALHAWLLTVEESAAALGLPAALVEVGLLRAELLTLQGAGDDDVDAALAAVHARLGDDPGLEPWRDRLRRWIPG